MTAAIQVELKNKFPSEYAGHLWAWLNAPRAPNFDDYGPTSSGDFLPWLSNRMRNERTWGIWYEGTLAGYLGFAQQSPMCGQFHGLVIKPSLRRRGIGFEAFSTAIELLRREGFEKFIVMPFADNEPIQAMLGYLGFVQEGLIEGATRRNGRAIDVRVYGLGAEANREAA